MNIDHSFLHVVSNCFIKLVKVVLHMTVNDFFFQPASKNGEIGRFHLESHFEPTLKISKGFIFCLNCDYNG